MGLLALLPTTEKSLKNALACHAGQLKSSPVLVPSSSPTLSFVSDVMLDGQPASKKVTVDGIFCYKQTT